MTEQEPVNRMGVVKTVAEKWYFKGVDAATIVTHAAHIGDKPDWDILNRMRLRGVNRIISGVALHKARTELGIWPEKK